jgi:hypothetical protein
MIFACGACIFLCDVLITHSGESYRICVCVFNGVQHRNLKREGLGQIWAVVPKKHLITQLVILQNKKKSPSPRPRALKEGLFKIKRVILQ